MKTPFYEIHRSFGAKMLNFHGWEMPLHYSGIIDEHINTRTNISLFDVSHMGRFKVRGSNALDCLQILVTNDISKLDNNMALYSPICYENGGIIDDLIIYMFNRKKFLIVVNASNREKDLEWIIKHLKSATIVEDITDKIALLALQGPLAQSILEKAAIVDLNLNQLKPFNFTITNIFGIEYVNDLDENTTPLEAPLKWTVKFEKNEFIGKKALINQQINRKIVGFEVLEKRVARHGNEVLMNSKKIGFVTSGTFSPTLKKSIGFCLVPVYVNPNELIEINIGDKLYKAKVLSSTRFYKRK